MMTKRIISILFAIILVLGMSTAVFAAAEDVEFDTMVVDIPDILTDEEEREFDNRAWEMTQKYGCAVYIMITDTLEGYEAWEYNEILYSQLGLGYGSEKSAIVLLLSMNERQYDIMAHGYGNTAFTDYGKDVMAERFLDDFAVDDWYWGLNDYLNTCDEFLEMAANGEPFDVGSEGDSFGANLFGVLIATIVSCVIALVVCLIFKAQMKTARLATEAHDYQKELNLINHYDRFSHRDIRRVYNPPQDNDNNSGGGTTINAGGFSHKSGGF
ncbi:MAG: hypothetical protein E7482_04245 [Ruminococcaceae bacterium]|nr:hypothetical protein [Oscillospiraceae bacterium]